MSPDQFRGYYLYCLTSLFENVNKLCGLKNM
jgi:hypothetical protein